LTGAGEELPARRHIRIGRYGRPEEVAHMIMPLTAVEVSFVNGAVIAVVGGMTARSH
jgi:NAD(P)-dependent dehydrogenase (short-subunit alcohol dehydrogenase family)